METWVAPALAGMLVLLALTVMGCAPARGRTLAGFGAVVAMLTVLMQPLIGAATGGALLATGGVLVLVGGGVGRRQGISGCRSSCERPSRSGTGPASRDAGSR